MPNLDSLDTLFVVSAFFFQIVLIAHFALRRWRFPLAIRWGWIVYTLSLAATLVSVILLLGGKPWALWLGGLLYLAWAAFGFTVEYVKEIQWRRPIVWPVFGPYVFLYLAAVMFYWWPLALVWKPLWYVYAVLFVVSTVLNVTSHRSAQT
ncbi:MAG TPA: hypothetical protein PLJ35_20355 [Anaerolineae bacterium]|nr:hypothetical protein [Anaerolineae bacterium]HOR01174.1 hypothetical protein [Anaerolineae bacterium]HPL27370.1 hypothetical protein [Anaerolineae bacterium]